MALMFRSFFRSVAARLLILYRTIVRTNGTWVRAGLCLAIGGSFLLLENRRNFDVRFGLRGPQSFIDKVVIVDLDVADWERRSGLGRSFIKPLRDPKARDDAYFWNEPLWESILIQILKGEPESVGITFYFPTYLENSQYRKHQSSLDDPRVYWLARPDSEGRNVFPSTRLGERDNTGFLASPQDEDRFVRRFELGAQEPPLALRLLGRQSVHLPEDELLTLNFRQPASHLHRISLAQLMSKEFDVNLLKDKIVIIGTSSVDSHLLRTPIGDMSRADLIATQIDNLYYERFIRILPQSLIFLTLIAILALTVRLLTAYPQSIAFVFLAWIAVGWTVFSLWLFDAYYFWTPILAPVSQVIVTYMVFLGYQLTLKENEAWRLEQERKYLSQIEQLKNNFVSLISHDLKTPIAKIQAICDRLLAKSPEPEIMSGLNSLRQESSELHRYIQSILKVSRVESRDFKINLEATDINESIENVVKQLKPLADQKEITLKICLDPIFLIEVDGLLIQEVILNLVENAIKYTPPKGLVTIRSFEIEDEVIVFVEDSGPGVPPENQDKIFEKFFRSSEQEHQTKGTGLGLYLVKYFVELHGGKVFLESELGKGTRIGFRLPMAEESVQLTDTLDVVGEARL